MPFRDIILATIVTAIWGFNFVIIKWGVAEVPPLLVLSLLVEGRDVIWFTLTHLSWQALGSVAYLAWGSTLIGYGLWNYQLSRHPAATGAPFYLLVLVFGIASGIFVMGDEFTPPMAWGGVMVFMGLLLNILGRACSDLTGACPGAAGMTD